MRRASTLWLALAFAIVASTRAHAQVPDPAVFINEIHYDNTGTDTGEFIEIAGPAGTDLSGYSIVLYNGSGGAAYTTTLLSGVIPDQQNGFGTLVFNYPSNGIQNGPPDGVALVAPGTGLVQFLSYEGVFTASGGAANGVASIDIGVSEAGTEPVGQALQLVGAGDSYEDFTWSAPSLASAGSPNAGQTFTSTSTPGVLISDVSVTEGDSGPATATFVVTVSTANHTGVTFDISTADGTGSTAATTADNDYVFLSTAAQILAGQTTYSFDVTVNGDTTFEPHETFRVVLSNVNGAALVDGEALGTITNDDEAPPVESDVVISQVYGGGGNSGATITHDFVELFNRGMVPVSVDGWSVQYASSAGTSWQVTPLSGSIAPGGYYLVQQASGAGGTMALPTPDAVGTIPMAAGSGKIALVSTTSPASGMCPSSNLADLVGYGAANCYEGAGPTAQLGNTTAALRKRTGCYDSNNNNVDFSAGNPTPRNSASRSKDCQPVEATISAIQGSGLASPLAGQDVVTTGVVTAKKSNGFFVQTPDGQGDGNEATSEAVFAFTGATPAVAVGDVVSIRGTVGEFFNLTQLESSLPGDVTVTSTGNAVPSPVTLTSAILDPAGVPSQLERFEGMRMSAASLTSVAPTDEFGEIAAVLTGVPRPLREPGISVLEPVPPDQTSGAPDCCIPRFDENPERIFIDTEGLLGASVLPVTSNVVLSSVTGPLDFTFGAYKILPEAPPAASANMNGVPVPMPAADEFTIGGFNIENFAGDETRKKKAALAIRQLMRSPDVIGHIEIRDEPTLQALADQVNDDAVAAGESNPQYEARLVVALTQGGTPSTQNVGFLVKTSRVRIDNVTQEPAGTFINPNTGLPELLHDRPPLVLRATFDPSGVNTPVIVVVNHLRSFIDIELVGGEGPRVRAKRKAQAESVAQLLQDLQVLHPGIPIMSIGDYNAYQFSDGYTDPIGTIKGMPTADEQVVVDASADVVTPNFINLTDTLPAAERYSFVFEGTPQALDHMLVNTVAASAATRYAIARGNSDFPELPASLFVNDATRPERSSDHDMPVAFFHFPDITPPVIEDLSDITVTATTFNGAIVNYVAPMATDAIDGSVPVVCTPPSGAQFALGSTTVTCTASDAAGNDASSSFTVTVVLPDDAGTMIGAGQEGSNPRVTFVFAAQQSAGGHDSAWIALTSRSSRGLPNTFVSGAINEVAFIGGTVRFGGVGWWNGHGSYSFEVTAADVREQGRDRDTFSIVVRNPQGGIVLQSSGRLTSGSVQSLP
ncbi:MAG: lamin tail domain-containing protein [Vicinamibacterales bacterium]